ncbi:phenylacetate--CoA ligase family protein [Sabulilitoribacter arenilitoris]|uniref:Phenylacetate--CoA ligase family protein n=1 Tax=Wocania arenilitoris TaxID=2044858 RepID=A0AAE3EKY8_9FLAO|nr:phenylacetate--CoA ligase family protein [Wocania arenilitoris]MCF7566786.1 phenylacetate--CoA ligase family protein [Wocania arenilitoris]
MLLKHEYFLFTLQKLSFLLKLFDLTLKLKGFPLKEAKTQLEFIQNKNDDDFKSYQETRKQDIVLYHLKHNPFYKVFAKNTNPLDWNSVPVITKQDLQQPLKNRLSEGFSKKTIHIHKTSGSSGTPFIFAKDKFCHALTWAIVEDRYGWFNINLNTSKQARFYGIPLHKKGYYKERLKDALSNRFRFSVFDLSDAQLFKNVEKFRETPFDYINGYTSPIVLFAKFLKKEHIFLKSICPTLKVCITTSEMLFEDDKKLLETQLGIPIVNEYGAAELGIIAFENTKNEWLLNTDDLFVEILDSKNNVLPLGEKGRIVITSLYNKANPFIRYDIGDIGALSKDGSNKKLTLKKLTGRTNDVAILPSGKKASGLTFYYVTKSIIEDDGNVKEFIIEQQQLDTFKIIYTSTKNISEAKKDIVKAEMEMYLEKGLTIIFERQDTIDRSNRGKLKQFSSKINQNL